MTGHGAQALGDFAQQSIAVLVPKRIISLLETIEIYLRRRSGWRLGYNHFSSGGVISRCSTMFSP
jgi:hypothetical protein